MNPLPLPFLTRRWRPGLMGLTVGAAFALAPQQGGAATAGGTAQAQPGQPDTGGSAPSDDLPTPAGESEVGFAADTLAYDSDADILTASGSVQMVREGYRLRADTVTWNRATGAVVATGNVSVTDPEGSVAHGDQIEVTDTLKEGVVQNLLLVLADGGRIGARSGSLSNGIYSLDRASYSPCPVEDAKGCPKEPSWVIKAVRVRYDPQRQRVSYRDATLEMFGVPIAVLPTFSHPVGERAGTGLLVPDIRFNGVNGIELATPYYVRIAPNRDLTVTPHVFTQEAPMLELAFRSLNGRGAYQLGGYVTSSRQSGSNVSGSASDRQLRGYVDGSGTFRFSPEWSLSSSFRVASDRTFLRRYNISRDDRLRSTVNLEHIDADSYLSIAGWAFQTLRLNDPQGQMPIALPVIDYRLRLQDPLLGGGIQLQANSLAITRSAGQDTQRAFASAQWQLRRLTGMGQELTFTAYARGDVYHSSDNALTTVPAYAGDSGWQTRGIAAAAAEMRWPFIGAFMGGTQRITPRLQVVASPRIANLSLPNEDSRSVDLDEGNLFALNRFPGYDRFEDTTRITYGVEYALNLEHFSLESVVGQSYRISRRPTLLPDGTGLSERLSDIVGRTTVRYRNFISLTHRFRLDKDNLAVRRNEVDATVGSRRTYVMASYLRLDRNVTAQLEDLADREEVRLGARVAFARYWSVFGSTVIDLTGKREDPGSATDGFEPVRHRVGIAYQDPCLEIGLTWKRDYRSTGDARTNNTFQLQLAFRNLGL